MSLDELLPALHGLPRAEKLRLIQVLAADLAREERAPFVEANASLPVWTPHHAYDAASTLLAALKAEEGTTP